MTRSIALIGLLLTSVAAADHLSRASVIARATVWQPTNVPAMDLKTGPDPGGRVPIGDPFQCTYIDKKLNGNTPKFWCTEAGEEFKVKVGAPDNGEVFAEVMATRLLWALGFGADRMYSVRVTCHGCPAHLKGGTRTGDVTVFDPAAVERKMPGKSFDDDDDGWSWDELDRVSEQAGGASRAERDALKLLAVFIQHTDTKKEQQRLACIGATDMQAKLEKKQRERAVGTTGSNQTDRPTSAKGVTACERPFMLINDLGLTFGKANLKNDNKPGSANLVEWSKTPIWRDQGSCVGHLSKSMTGSLEDPIISEDGRRFLADLLVQLTDQQLHDLFDAAQITKRVRDPKDPHSGFPTVEEWVQAFKAKRDAIVNHRCSAT